MWQDWVIALIIWIFLAALIPTILDKKQKPALSTALITGIGMAILTFTYATLELWQSVISGVLITIAWFVLAWQRWKLNQKEKQI